MNAPESTNTASADAVGAPVERPVRPLLERLRDVESDGMTFAGEAADEIERLRAERDCRTCRNFRGTQHCHSVLRCVDGSSYQRGGVVQLWEAAPIEPAPF